MATKITYTQQGDYLLPNLELPNQPKVRIGIWGKRHLSYIKQHRKIRYYNLLTSCELTTYLANIEERAEKMFEKLLQAFVKEEGCTEQLKETYQMQWVRKMNNATQRAREVVNAEIIYN